MMAQIPICLFAKPPLPGQVKTRLAPPGRAAELARAFLQDTYAAIAALPWAVPIVATTGPMEGVWPASIAPTLWPQGQGDLGERIERVLARALERAPAALAIGADAPSLPLERYEQARLALAGADAVLGPADDGGFYLLGLRRCPAGLLHELPWSRDDTLVATRARLESFGLTVALLEPWFDLDRPEDLERLRRELGATPSAAPATRAALAGARISVIMPVVNEAARLPAALDDVLYRPGLHEVIVVDGGSGDASVEIAQAKGARVVAARRGRGPQLNAGAAIASGEVLLFLHADTTLPPNVAGEITRALADPGVVAGAFRTWTVADEPRPWFAPLLHAADVRSRVTRYPYGDQALFVRAEVFARAGGFLDIPLMEDLELSRRLWRYGELRTCAASVRVSGRRFIARPIVYTALVNLFPLLYRAGVSPHTLARLYGHVR